MSTKRQHDGHPTALNVCRRFLDDVRIVRTSKETTKRKESNPCIRNQIDAFQILLDTVNAEGVCHFSSWCAPQSKPSNKVCWLVACLTSQQQASVSQGRICTDSFTCCHTETEVADPTIYLTQSQYTGTGPTSPSADPITPGAWQGGHLSANF